MSALTVHNHSYEGDGGPCASDFYGETCGEPRSDHESEYVRDPATGEWECQHCGEGAPCTCGQAPAPEPQGSCTCSPYDSGHLSNCPLMRRK